MAKQTTPATLTSAQSAQSFALQTINPSLYYNTSLTGGFSSGTAHTSTISSLQTVFSGDTIVATGTYDTLIGGAGNDSLLAIGRNDYLIAGTGVDTLVGTTLRGAFDTLVGNGKSSLVGRGGNDVFVLNFNGDKISEIAGANNTIKTSVNSFSLSDSLGHGAGVLNVANLIYSQAGGATLVGNAMNGSLIGGTTGANSLVAGSGTETLIGGGTVFNPVNDTFIGNGHSSLVAGYGNDIFVINTPGDQIYVPPTSIVGGATVTAGSETILTTATLFSLADTFTSGSGILQISTLQSTDTLTNGTSVTLYGNGSSNTLIGALNTSDYLAAGGGYESLVGGNSNDTFIGDKYSTLNGGTGVNTYYIPSQGGDVIQDNSHTLVGGKSVSGGGTLVLLNSSTATISYNLAASPNLSSITTLIYSGNAPATLSGNANPLGDTIIGGIGTNSLIGDTSGKASLVGSGSNDTLNDNNGISASTLFGGGGTDLFIVTNAKDLIQEPIDGTGSIETNLHSYSLSDPLAANGTGITNLTYTGNGPATLTGNIFNNILDASSASAATIIGGAAAGAQGFDTMVGSATGTNLFEVISPSDLGNLTSIVGGAGTGTIQLLNPGSITDTAFGIGTTQFISNVEALQLTDSASLSSSVTLGAAADNTGISSVIGGIGSDSFTQTSLNGNGIYFQGGAKGSNSFNLASGELGADTILGGITGKNTLQISGSDVLDDTDFLNVHSIQTLKLTSPSTAFLGSFAQAAGLTTVMTGIGSDTLNASAFTKSITLNAASSTTGSLLLGGSQSDSLIGGSGKDSLQGWSSLSNVGIDTLSGGSGADLLILGNSTGNITSHDLISNFAQGTDILQLHNYSGSGASAYSLVSGSFGAFNTELFDKHAANHLVANINVISGTPGNILTNAHFV